VEDMAASALEGGFAMKTGATRSGEERYRSETELDVVVFRYDPPSLSFGGLGRGPGEVHGEQADEGP